MPTWDSILREILIKNQQGIVVKNQSDEVRRKYLKLFSDLRNRNVILYYSDWLNEQKRSNLDINDGDMSGFMNAVQGLDKTKGLDLILHTPGGNPTATESIVKYLHTIFNNDIEVFVPHLAMSAGTMLACSAKTIWMGKQSSLGPIDPQFSGIPAYNIKKEFEEAKDELEHNPNAFRNWQIRLAKYPQAFYYIVNDAIELSSKLVKSWLKDYMFSDSTDKNIVESIIRKLNINTGSHSTHFSKEQCKSFGLKIKDLEENQDIQDLVLSIYHSSQITCSTSTAVKIIENQNGKAFICNNMI